MIKKLLFSNIRYGIIHCTDSDPNVDIRAIDIHQWHLERKDPFDMIGYHKVIRGNGIIEIGRPDYIRGAHCKGLNWCSLSVVLVGIDRFSGHQLSSLLSIVSGWIRDHPTILIGGHYQFDDKKTCPNIDIPKLLSPYFPNNIMPQ